MFIYSSSRSVFSNITGLVFLANYTTPNYLPILFVYLFLFCFVFVGETKITEKKKIENSDPVTFFKK